MTLLKDLQKDFRGVEEKFREIIRQVQHRLARGRDSRGGILEFALDAEEVLKTEDQGVSFYEFFRFILSPIQQEKLQAVIHELCRIRELADQYDGLATIRRMIPMLVAEAEKVMRTNQRLSAMLRRLLDVQSYRERRRVASLLCEIRGLAASMAASPPRGRVAISVETKPAVSSPVTRSFWSEPQKLSAVDLREHIADDEQRKEAFRLWTRMHRLDWNRMRRRVHDVAGRSGGCTLGDVLDIHPPDAGVIEVLGYVQIACDDGHIVQRDAEEQVVIPSRDGDRVLAVTVPLIRFVVT